MTEDYKTAHTKTGGEQLTYENKAEGVHSVSHECSDTFEALKLRRKHKYIIFKIGDFEIQVEKAGGRRETYEEFKASLPFTDCRFAVYDQEYRTADGRPASKIWFISWFPQNSTPYNKMAYTTAKTHFRDAIPGVFDAMAASLEDLDRKLGRDGCGTDAGEEDNEDNEFDD